jgi:hypothetical protein
MRHFTVAEQPVNLPTAIYLGVFSRAEQRVLQAIFKAIADGGGRCVATLAMLARDSNTSKSTTRNAITQAAAIGLLEKTERRSYCAVSLPNILSLREELVRTMTLQKKAKSIARHLYPRVPPNPQRKAGLTPSMQLRRKGCDAASPSSIGTRATARPDRNESGFPRHAGGASLTH